MSSAEFIGFTNVRSEPLQPQDSELCFATLMARVSDLTIEEVHEVLQQEGLSQEDGTTALLGEVSLKFGEHEVSLEPVEVDEDPAAILSALEKQFTTDNAVVLPIKKNTDPEDRVHRWVMLTGYAQNGTHSDRFHLIDPKTSETSLVSRKVVEDVIARTADRDNGGQGVFPFALTTSAGSRPPLGIITVVPAYDREPAPIEETYSTGQDKIVWTKNDQAD